MAIFSQWAWWLYLLELLGDTDFTRADKAAAFRTHIDIGLSVTVLVRVEKDSAALAKWSMERGSQNSVIQGVSETDSFVAFARRVAIFVENIDEKSRLPHLLRQV